MRLKSKLAAAALGAALMVTTLAGCSAGDSGGNNGSEGAGSGAPLTIAKPDGSISTESNNPWIPDSSANRLGYINAMLEPLGIVSLIDPTKPTEPWLAQEITWADDYKSVTLTARDGVTWSDGEPFTADDIAYTFTQLRDVEGLDNSALGLTDITVDGSTVTLGFENSMFAKQDKVLHKLIVPRHIFEKSSDVTTDTFTDLVGTGPYALSNWTTESIELTARSDYWGGTPAAPTLYYVSYNDNTALTTALANGDADWAQSFIPNVQDAYLNKDKEHNVYWAPAGLAIDTMFLNTTKAPFDDLAFRQAVNAVVDREKHQSIAREGGVPELTSVTGLPTPAGDAFIAPDYADSSYKVDVDAAKKILTDAGYTYDGDTLVGKDGKPVTFTLSVPQGWNDYVTGIMLISDELKAIGVEAKVDTPDADTWWANKEKGDFDAILHWTDTGATPYDLYSDIMDGRWLKPIGENASYNFGRFDNAEATSALNAYANATDDATRTAALATIEKIFVEQVPAIPVGTRPFISQYNTRSYVGWPDDANPYVPADPTQPTAVKILMSLTPAK